MPTDSPGQAGANQDGDTAELCVNQALKGVERFSHDIADLHKRWDNRIVLERCSVAELYLNGRIDIALYGNGLAGFNDVNWLCRVSAEASERIEGAASDVEPGDTGEGDCGDEQIVLVVVVEGVECPETFVRSVGRAQLIKKKFRSTREGLLYRREGLGFGYEVLPVFPHREVDLSFGVDRANNRGCQMIECAPEIMNGITNHQRQQLWDWLRRLIIQCRITVNRTGVVVQYDRIEFRRQGLGDSSQLINVAIGPLNL